MNVKPNHHERIRADLKAYADGELSPLARFVVARHLRACPSCREELIQMQTLSTEIRESEPEAAPLSSDLRAHILDNAPIIEGEFEEIVERPRRVSPRKAIFAAGMAVLVAVVLFPMFARTREYARRSSPDRSANSMIAPDPIAPSFSSGAASSSTVPDAAPKNSPVIGNTYTEDAKMPGRNEANGMFSDGHTKERIAIDRLKSAQGQEEQQGIVDARRRAGSAFSSDDEAQIRLGNSQIVSNGPVDAASVVPATRTVHREGSISVAVQNAESAGDDAASIVKNAGGFIANTSLETGSGQKRTAVLDCRVPVAQFETVVKKIGALGKVRSKSLNGQDITAQVASSGARKKTLSNELSIAQARLKKLENTRKPNAYDLYQLRAEVRTLRIQASQARAALETLQKYGALSSLYVSLQDGVMPATPQAAGWFDTLSPSTQAAWKSFLSNAQLPIQLIFWILAYSPIWLPLLIVWKKFGRKWIME